jgi:hypothetical protein
MFDGTDLHMAYGNAYSQDSMGGGNGNGNGGMYNGATPLQHNIQLPPPPQSSMTEQIVLPPPSPAATSHAQPPDVMYDPPVAMYAQNKAYVTEKDTIWDKLSSKKMDVLKLVTLSLVILFAMSTDRAANFYLSKYISSAYLSSFQEVAVRLSYPVIVLLIMWIIKAMA